MSLSGREPAVLASVRYLESYEATRSLEANLYWPKWNSPWWHMTLLHEMGLADRIPEVALRKLIERLKASPLTIFPLRPGDVPVGVDVALESHCHCALGNIYRVLAAAGVDVDSELPWIRPWFLRYQVPDGGLNCDEQAYLKDPPPSSMVATIAPLEAVLLHTPRPFAPEEERFLDLGARCLLDRRLMHATTNLHNAEEKEDEQDWLRLCFPRFYLYDVLRGLSFVLKWAEVRDRKISMSAIGDVVRILEGQFPDGQVRVGRLSYEGISTRSRAASGEWRRGQPAATFPLLDQVSRVGEVSPELTLRWAEARRLLAELVSRGSLS